MKEDKKVVLHPSSAQSLMDRSLQAIEQEDFQTALRNLDQLLAHGVENFQINIGKIICLIQLGEQTDAILFCEEVMEDERNEHFFDYLFYYVTLLFEANEYAKLIAYIDNIEKNMDIDPAHRTSYEEIYHMCVEMNARQALELWENFLEELREKNAPKAWIAFHDWAACQVTMPNDFKELLANNDIHPVIQTEILLHLKRSKMNQTVKIHKFDEVGTIDTNMLHAVEGDPLSQEVLGKIQSLEDENPSQHEAMTSMLHHFMYVHYPFAFPKEDVQNFVDALYGIQEHQLLFQPSEEKVTNPYVAKLVQAMNLYIELVL
ncbi:MAG TPA: hypothetical protein VK067_08350 [Pseudogracilibacillus sp.]|nr:hypothetical protein [Pseudogracilibacillus sp.]